MWIEYWRFALEKGNKKQPRRNAPAGSWGMYARQVA